MTVVKYEPEADPESLLPSFDVALTNVVLPMFDNMGSDYPSSVTVRSARLVLDYF